MDLAPRVEPRRAGSRSLAGIGACRAPDTQLIGVVDQPESLDAARQAGNRRWFASSLRTRAVRRLPTVVPPPAVAGGAAAGLGRLQHQAAARQAAVTAEPQDPAAVSRVAADPQEAAEVAEVAERNRPARSAPGRLLDPDTLDERN